MTVEPAHERVHDRALRTVKLLALVAIVAAVFASVVGVALLVIDPDAGSTLEAALAVTAAVGGLCAAGCVVAAVVYARVKNLWRHAPDWVRIAVWVIAVLAIGLSLVRTISD